VSYDPSWSDSTRDDIFNDLGYALGLHAFAKSIEFFLHPQNAAFLPLCTDENVETYTNTWRITAGKPGTDTDANGWIWGRYDDNQGGAGTVQIRFYKGSVRDNSAGNELIASATGSDNSTLTITPQTGYTLAGTVKVTAATADFDFRMQLLVPPIKRLLQLFDGTSADDDQIRAAGEGVLKKMRGGALTMKAAATELAVLIMRTKVRRNLVSRSNESAIIIPNPQQTSGVVTYRPSGLAEDLRAAMDANTGGSAEVKVSAGAFSGAVSYPSGGWAGSATTPTYGERALAGTITLRCVQGLGGEPPKFRLTRSLTDRRRAPNDGKDDEVLASRFLWIGQEFQAKEWGIEALTINYLPTIANVTTNLLSTTATDWSCTGLTDENSTDGEVFIAYDGTTLKAYATEEGRTNADSSDVVAQRTTATSEDATVVTLSPVNDSGLTIVGKTGAGNGSSLLVAGTVGDVDFNPPSADEPVATATITIIESTEVGAWGEALRDEVFGTGQGWVLNTGGSPNVVDGQVNKGLPMCNAAVLGDRT
jgi:hypothetical protein